MDLSRFIWKNSINTSTFKRVLNILTAAAICSRRFNFGPDRVADGVSDRTSMPRCYTLSDSWSGKAIAPSDRSEPFPVRTSARHSVCLPTTTKRLKQALPAPAAACAVLLLFYPSIPALFQTADCSMSSPARQSFH